MPRRDRTYNDSDLVRFYHRNLTPFEKDSAYNQICRVDCGKTPLMLDSALDYLIEVRGNPAIRVLHDILEEIAGDDDLKDHVLNEGGNIMQLNAIPVSIKPIPPIIKWAMLLWRLLSIKQFIGELINMIDPTIEVLQEVSKILDQVCKQKENAQE